MDVVYCQESFSSTNNKITKFSFKLMQLLVSSGNCRFMSHIPYVKLAVLLHPLSQLARVQAVWIQDTHSPGACRVVPRFWYLFKKVHG